jgi:hypothetical protein
MNDKIVNFGEKTNGVSPINAKTEEFTQKHEEDFKKAQKNSKNDTEFWDKYVGVQLEEKGRPIKVDNNVPSSGSQLQNNPDRFKGEDITKMVMASLKDADAMLFHIYAKASKEGRELSEDENQQINDICSGKIRLAQSLSTLDVKNKSFEGDVILRKNKYNQWLVYEELGGGEPIAEYNSLDEALTDYPEGQVQNA